MITFNSQTSVENNYDYIYIYDGAGNQIAKYTGTTAANRTLTITGDTFKVRLTSDYSNVKYGYAFSSIQAHMGTVGEIIHQPVIDPATVTCTQDGLTEGSHCEICGDILVEQEEAAALGHDYKTVFTYDDGVIKKEATETEEGLKVYTCTVCKGEKEEVIPMISPETTAPETEPETVPIETEPEETVNTPDTTEEPETTDAPAVITDAAPDTDDEGGSTGLIICIVIGAVAVAAAAVAVIKKRK